MAQSNVDASTCGPQRLGGSAGPEPLQCPREALDALIDLVRRNGGERETQAGSAALEHEIGAGDEGDALLLRLGEQGGRVDVIVEIEPKEVAALGHHELRLGDVLAERLD